MGKIAVYRHAGQVWYDSFAEVVEDFTTGNNVFTNAYTGKQENHLKSFIGNIVLYNVCYRDVYRAGGVDALHYMLFKEAPAFRKEKGALHSLEKELDYRGKLGNYDIQCLSVDDSFCVHGHVFHGLDDVRAHVESFMHRGRKPFRANDYRPLPDDVHILCNYMPYPIFDIYDLGDSRDYSNYFFKVGCFSGYAIDRISAIPETDNFNKAHEKLTCIAETPLLYCDGDSTAMLLVTPR